MFVAVYQGKTKKYNSSFENKQSEINAERFWIQENCKLLKTLPKGTLQYKF